MVRTTLLIVDNDHDVRERLATVARQELPQTDIMTAETAPEAFSNLHGTEAAPFVIVSSFESESWRIRVGHLPDVQAFVHRPPSASELIRVVRGVLPSPGAGAAVA